MFAPAFFIASLLCFRILVSATVIQQFAASNKLSGTSFGIPGQDATYDYVIIGAGIAGSVVAKRLTEDPRNRVAIIEAGSFVEISNGNLSQIPLYATRFTGDDGGNWIEENRQPLIDWGLVTQPEPGLNGRRLHEAQGKCFGGSSSRNLLYYHRGTVGAYAKWAELVGDDNYTWEKMLPYFEKSINFSTSNLGKRAANASVSYNASAFSFSGGPLRLSFPTYAQPMSSYGAAMLSHIGLSQAVGFNSGSLKGYGYSTFTQDANTGLRSSAETSFLAEAFEKSTLTAYVQTLATKILFNEQKQATGVEISTHGLTYNLTARREVILSAGAIQSPKLLMLSGIGPADALKQHDISIISDLPGVGQNMWNSANLGGVIYEIDVTTTQAMSDPVYAAEQVSLFLNEQAGQLTNSGGDFIGFEKLPNSSRSHLGEKALSELSQFPSDWPEVEYLLVSSRGASSSTKPTATLGAALVATLSRGNITLASTDPFELPIMYGNFLLEETDQRVAIEVFKRLRQAWQAVPTSVRGAEVFPGANVTRDADLLEAIKGAARPVHHISATCKMGKPDDPMAVVDSKARVFGVQGLRVIDASSFVFTPPGHTQAYTYAHAEKLSDDVKDGS